MSRYIVVIWYTTPSFTILPSPPITPPPFPPSLSSTCYYSLCLISKTKAGANVLFDNNWITVQHSAEEKWPLTFDTQQELDDAGVPLSPDAYPIRFFPPLFGSFDLNSLPRRSGLPKASSYQVLTTTSPSSREHSRSLSSHSTLSLRRVIEPSSRRTPPPPSRFISVRKPGRKMFTSLKDKGRVSPSLSRLRVKSSADVTWMQANTLSHRSLGQSKQFSISTGELLSPDLHKARYNMYELAQHTYIVQPKVKYSV